MTGGADRAFCCVGDGATRGREGTIEIVRGDRVAQLLRRAKRGDQDAYEQLYAIFVERLFRYLYVRCGSVAQADDALGELWLRVVRYLPNFRIPADGAEPAFDAWLYALARNVVLDMARATAPQAAPLIDLRDPNQALAAAVDSLPPPQREVILLRFREDMSTPEVARRTGQSEAEVKAIQHEALAALAQLTGAGAGAAA